MPVIKIYGERNTGTNYLAKLIELNLKADQLPGVMSPLFRKLKRFFPEELVLNAFFFFASRWNLGWKHAVAPDPLALGQLAVRASRARFITITKNPYSWLLSLHKRPYHHESSREQDFESFLQSRWNTVKRENAPHSVDTPIDLWNLKNASYIALNNGDFPTMNIRFEDLLESPEDIIRQISGDFQCQMKLSEFQNLNQSAKGHEKDSDYYRDYYLNEKWRPALSTRSIQIINERLDAETMAHFGYNYLD